GATQHFDPVGRTELEVRELSLAVRQGLWNSIHQHLDPPHGECRSGAEAADRDTLIEREVVAVGRVHTGNCYERLVQAPGGPRTADLGLLDELDGLGDAIDRRVSAGHGDDGRREWLALQAGCGTCGGRVRR